MKILGIEISVSRPNKATKIAQKMPLYLSGWDISVWPEHAARWIQENIKADKRIVVAREFAAVYRKKLMEKSLVEREHKDLQKIIDGKECEDLRKIVGGEK